MQYKEKNWHPYKTHTKKLSGRNVACLILNLLVRKVNIRL